MPIPTLSGTESSILQPDFRPATVWSVDKKADLIGVFVESIRKKDPYRLPSMVGKFAIQDCVSSQHRFRRLRNGKRLNASLAQKL